MLRKAFRMSFHVKWQFIPQLWLKAGWENNNIPYIGFNYNVIYSMPEMINYLGYDFHLGYSVPETERGVTMMNKLSTDFGPTREQRESKRLYDQLILAPMDAYNEAMRLYLGGEVLGGVVCVREGDIAVSEFLFERQGDVLHGQLLPIFADERDSAGGIQGGAGGIYDVGHAAEVSVWIGEHRLS